jgi:arylsulfatase A-like enzyme
VPRRRCGAIALVAIATGGCTGSGEKSAQAKPVEAQGDGPLGRDLRLDPAGPGDRAARPEHALWHLGPNRHLAHRLVDGDLVVDAGAPGFARHTGFGLPEVRWQLGAVVDGEPAARPARGATVELPLTAAQAAAAATLLVRVHAAKPGRLTVQIDGRTPDGGQVRLDRGWQTVAIPSAGRWREGENLVGLTSSLGDGLHVRWLRVAHAGASDADPLAHARWDGAAFQLASGAGLAWYALVPDGAVLVGDVDGPCTIGVVARAGGDRAADGALVGTGGRVDLGALAGQVARLELSTRDCAGGGRLRDARITAPGATPPAAHAGPPPRYVVFWVMDALRADRIPTFQPGARADTPSFDRLGAAGAVFRHHYVGGNESQVSHASMFTGLYPAAHAVRTAGEGVNHRIPRRFATIGQRMRAAGYYTIGVTGNGFVGDFGGYARGFAEFRNLMKEQGVKNGVIPGRVMLDDVLRRLDRRRDEHDRIFVFMGTIDTHSPLRAHHPWIDRYDPGPYDGPFQRGTTAGPLGIERGKMGCHKVPPAREIERMRAIYDSAVSYQDALLGDLIAALEQRGIADETMIVISSDHGEELFEEDRCGHGASLRETLVRVPLLVHYPPRVAARVVEVGTEGVDVLPTILDAAGAPADGVQGQSLRALAAAPVAWPQPSFASQFEYAFAVRIGAWKLRVPRSGRAILHDLDADPLERTNLAAARPIERRFLTDHLGLYLAHRGRWTKSTWGVVSNMTEHGATAMEAR